MAVSDVSTRNTYLDGLTVSWRHYACSSGWQKFTSHRGL